MFKWKDRVYINARKRVFKNLDTNEMLNLELQDDTDNIVTESETPLTAYCLNQAQQELVDDISGTYDKVISEVNEDIDKMETKLRDITTYSTEEQIVGKWIDGKTLYRKVLTYNSTINANTLFKIGEVNSVEKVISMNYVIRNSNGSQWINDYVNVNEQICSFTLIMQTTDGFLYGRSNSEAWSSPFLIVTIEYTKTTA